MSKYSGYDTTNMISFNFTALEATRDNPPTIEQRLLEDSPRDPSSPRKGYEWNFKLKKITIPFYSCPGLSCTYLPSA